MRPFRRPDDRSMARPASPEGRPALSPRARLFAGWLAVFAMVMIIGGAVRLFGGNADGDDILPTPSSSSAAGLLPITFGTELGPDRLVLAASQTDRFTADDTFAYSVNDAAPASEIYVAVRRTSGGPIGVVQRPTDAQAIPGAPALIGFKVAASALFKAFGPGTYEMLIHLQPEQPPIAGGTFRLIATATRSGS